MSSTPAHAQRLRSQVLDLRVPSGLGVEPAASLPVAVIGAGPVGLAAAAHLVSRGETPLVFEAGAAVGASVARWAHVRVFSPWRYNVDPASASLLAARGWAAPDPDHLPTGRELIEDYLAPLAALPEIAPHLRLGTRVLAVTRMGFDKMKTAGRAESPFVLHVQTTVGEESQVLARAVIDASGTYGRPNPLGTGGVPAGGEQALADRIVYGIPDVLGPDRGRYAGRRVLVVGSGHSAFNALLDLATLARDAPGTTVAWAIRRTDLRQLYGGQGQDALPARGGLGAQLRALVEGGAVELVAGFQATRLVATPDGIVVVGMDRVLAPVDEIVAATGFRPDLSFLGELRLGLDPAVESPVALAPLIDPNVHSCGSVPPHGAAELAHPEPGFYAVGMKSYGRAPTFLMRTGYEQVRSVVCALTGDATGAAAVELELPETGVCSSGRADGRADGAGETACCGSDCCSPEAVAVSAAVSAAVPVAAAACCAPTCCA